MLDDPRRTMQLLTLIIAGIGIISGLAKMRLCKNQAYCYMAVAPLIWLCHVCVFYVAVLFTDLAQIMDFTAWSAAVRIHGVLTVITLMLALLRRE